MCAVVTGFHTFSLPIFSAKDYRALVAKPPAEPRDIKPPKKARKRAVPIKGTTSSKEPPSFLSAIVRLMAYAHPRNLKIKAEERLAIDFANALQIGRAHV